MADGLRNALFIRKGFGKESRFVSGRELRAARRAHQVSTLQHITWQASTHDRIVEGADQVSLEEHEAVLAARRLRLSVGPHPHFDPVHAGGANDKLALVQVPLHASRFEQSR